MKQTLCFQIRTMAVLNEHSVLLEVSMLPTYYILIGSFKLACSFFPIIYIYILCWLFYGYWTSQSWTYRKKLKLFMV